MRYIKSHFWFNKRQRNGIFVLLVLILIFQVSYWYIKTYTIGEVAIENDEIKAFQKQIDSLKAIEKENSRFKIYPFNPNFISDFKGYQLGMSTKEIDRLHQFRAKNKYVNSAKEFQKITKVSDSLLAVISPYFKFPAWTQKKKNTSKNKIIEYVPIEKMELSTNDLNKATVDDFTILLSGNKTLAERIIKYRTKLQGFTYDEQLKEVWGMTTIVKKQLLKQLTIVEKPIIKKINVNTASFKEVLAIPYIDYELCKKIFNYRDEVAEIQNITELKNIEGLNLEKYNRIVLYLEAK